MAPFKSPHTFSCRLKRLTDSATTHDSSTREPLAVETIKTSFPCPLPVWSPLLDSLTAQLLDCFTSTAITSASLATTAGLLDCSTARLLDCFTSTAMTIVSLTTTA